MNSIESIDDHLVIHDAATVGISTALGVVASAVTGDPAAGVATTIILAAAGIGAMEIGPVRRGVNRAALAVADAVPSKPEQ